MRWKQFFTPVKSLEAPEARKYMEQLSPEEYNLIDVRQPGEYEAAHLPGAQLVPMADLAERSGEFDPDKPTVVYWAIGGRSRVAAQMLAGKGFTNVINMSGGIRAWDNPTAAGSEDAGLHLFSGDEPLPETLIVAYSLEAGLRDFYLAMRERLGDSPSGSLFAQLADIEIKHQDSLLAEYEAATGEHFTREDFEARRLAGVVEGGLTTEEYMARFNPDLDRTEHVISLAMTIEAQALDLYLRAAEQAAETETRDALLRIGAEERTHLKLLGELMDNSVAPARG